MLSRGRYYSLATSPSHGTAYNSPKERVERLGMKPASQSSRASSRPDDSSISLRGGGRSKHRVVPQQSEIALIPTAGRGQLIDLLLRGFERARHVGEKGDVHDHQRP